MNAKEYLGQAYRLDQRINITMEQVERLRSLTRRLTASCEGEAVSHTRNVSAMQDAILRLIEAEEQLNHTIDTLVEFKAEIACVIEQIPERNCRVLLEMRYLSLKDWGEIAAFLGMHVRSVHRWHSRALAAVEEIINAPGFESILKKVAYCH